MANDIDFSFEVAGSFSSFKVESFRVSEAVSTPFEMNLTVLSEDEGITFEVLSRKTGVLSVHGQGMHVARQFNGSVSELRYLGIGKTFLSLPNHLSPGALVFNSAPRLSDFSNENRARHHHRSV